MASTTTHDVTADSADLKSLLSTTDDTRPSHNANLLNVSAHSFVTMFAEAMTTIINDVKELPRILNNHRSPVSTVTSLPTSPGANVVHAARVSPPSPTTYPEPSAPSPPSPSVDGPLMDHSTKISITDNQPVFPHGPVYASGPPTDPVLFETQNFATRKSFHAQQGPSFDTRKVASMPSSTTTGGTPASYAVPIPEARYTSQAPQYHNAPPQPSCVHQTKHYPSVPDDPILAPKMEPHVSDHDSSPPFSPPTPKPMISFDMSKWAKHIHNVCIKDESYSAVLAWYDTIQQSMIISTGHANIMPDVDHLTKSFDFAQHILPGHKSSVFKAGYIQYVAMAKSLRLHLVHPDTISTSCLTLVVERDLHDSNKDGFVLLMKLLGSIFPHLGGPRVDMIKEISSIQLNKSETYDSLLYKFIKLKRKLTLAGHQVPATALFERYLSLLRTNKEMFELLSPIHRSFHDHISDYGPDVEFLQYSFSDVHKFLKKSLIPTDSLICPSGSQKKQSFAQTHAAHYLIPQANAALYSHLEGQDPFLSRELPSSHQANAATMAFKPSVPVQHRSRTPPCPVCFQRHSVLHCYSRGVDHQPKWLQRNAAKYNALHKDADQVEESFKNQPPPLRYSTVSAQANKSVQFSDVPTIAHMPSSMPPSISSISNHVSHNDTVYPGFLPNDDTSILSIHDQHEQHTSVTNPTYHMANVHENMKLGEEESFIEA